MSNHVWQAVDRASPYILAQRKVTLREPVYPKEYQPLEKLGQTAVTMSTRRSHDKAVTAESANAGTF